MRRWFTVAYKTVLLVLLAYVITYVEVQLALTYKAKPTDLSKSILDWVDRILPLI